MMNLILRNHNGFPLPIALRRTANDASFNRLINSMLADYFVPAGAQEPAAIAPRMNVAESEQAFEIEAELPGVAKENLNISVDGKRVSIEAEVKRASERKEGEKIIHEERVIKKFSRNFLLSEEVDDARATAKLENGILRLSLPKKADAKPKQITVQ
jgi:HSP20 family protein